MEYLQDILDLMNNGNWNDAQKLFKAINPTGREFGDAMESLSDEELRDIALLGFYCREYTPDDNIVNY